MSYCRLPSFFLSCYHSPRKSAWRVDQVQGIASVLPQTHVKRRCTVSSHDLEEPNPTSTCPKSSTKQISSVQPSRPFPITRCAYSPRYSVGANHRPARVFSMPAALPRDGKPMPIPLPSHPPDSPKAIFRTLQASDSCPLHPKSESWGGLIRVGDVHTHACRPPHGMNTRQRGISRWGRLP